MNADLTLEVGKWIGIPGEVRDSQLRIEIGDGQLKAPMQTIVADVLLTGEVGVDTTAQVPDFLLRLGTERSKLGRLAEVFARVRACKATWDGSRCSSRGVVTTWSPSCARSTCGSIWRRRT